jgi:hypothetical protein
MTAVTRERPLIQANDRFDDIKVRTQLNETRKGRLNNGGSFTLAANATQTTVSDGIVTTNSVILAMAETSEARDKPVYIPRTTIVNGSFVAQHASTSNSACSYSYGVFC